jgi:small subunit ribosomal protein S4
VTKVLKSKFKLSRRLGISVWGSAKDPFNKKNYKPGQHGPVSIRKLSDFAKQLNAKQLLKGYYGRITERQFRSIFDEAARMKGDTGENLIGLLESRLDAIVYRMNLASTVFASRQLVTHKHVFVDGAMVNIPSYVVKPGSVVQIRDSSTNIVTIEASVAKMERAIPDYIEFDQKAKKGKYIRVPKFAEVPYPCSIEPQLVVEFYSR